MQTKSTSSGHLDLDVSELVLWIASAGRLMTRGSNGTHLGSYSVPILDRGLTVQRIGFWMDDFGIRV